MIKAYIQQDRLQPLKCLQMEPSILGSVAIIDRHMFKGAEGEKLAFEGGPSSKMQSSNRCIFMLGKWLGVHHSYWAGLKSVTVHICPEGHGFPTPALSISFCL